MAAGFLLSPCLHFGPFDNELKPADSPTRIPDVTPAMSSDFGQLRAQLATGSLATGTNNRRLASADDSDVVVASVEAYAVPIPPSTLLRQSRQLMEAIVQRRWGVR
jgi:hypothetical protein